MTIKTKIYNELLQVISLKLMSIHEALTSAKESRDADTKSSAGDKHETSRALAQMEIDKLEVQLGKMLLLESELKAIDANKKNEQVETGSLVFTNGGNYFISIGLGKIELEENTYYAISLGSPIGEILKWKKVEEKFVFQGKEMVIERIL